MKRKGQWEPKGGPEINRDDGASHDAQALAQARWGWGNPAQGRWRHVVRGKGGEPWQFAQNLWELGVEAGELRVHPRRRQQGLRELMGAPSMLPWTAREEVGEEVQVW